MDQRISYPQKYSRVISSIFLAVRYFWLLLFLTVWTSTVRLTGHALGSYFQVPWPLGGKVYDKNYDCIISVEDRIRFALWWLNEWAFLVVYVQLNDRIFSAKWSIISKSKFHILWQIVYFQSKNRILLVLESYTCTFRNDRILYVWPHFMISVLRLYNHQKLRSFIR